MIVTYKFIKIILQLISYICCWFPYACMSIAETAGYTPKTDKAYYILAIPTMLTKTSVCVDPIIYFWLNPQFSGELYRWCGCGSVSKTNSNTITNTNQINVTRMSVNRKHGSRSVEY